MILLEQLNVNEKNQQGKATSVPSLAKSVLFSFGTNVAPHAWPEHEWNVFRAVCAEELAPDAIELAAAKMGVICHSNKLTPQVRMATENLMRSTAPRIIIATMTLGQGVNVGISSVIVASPYIGQDTTISKRDFWNICGRAGRAFVDGEGKILYTIDQVKTTARSPRAIQRDEQLATWYFDVAPTGYVESGILQIISELQSIAKQAGVHFDLLLELVANDDFSSLGEHQSTFEDMFDLLDDELLAMNEDSSINRDLNDAASWIDKVFKKSLAAIQTRRHASVGEDSLLKLISARIRSIFIRIPNPDDRRSISASGLPLSIAILAKRDLDYFRHLADFYIQSDESLEALTNVLQNIERWSKKNAASIVADMPNEAELNALRKKWIEGVGLRELIEENSDASEICRDLYGYQLPWIINAISQKLSKENEQERVDAFSKIALLTELGLPSELAARIFLAGIRSRVAASEFASLPLSFGNSISAVVRNFRDAEFTDLARIFLSPASESWLDMLAAERTNTVTALPQFSNFTLNAPIVSKVLFARTYQRRIFLCSLDGSEKVEVDATLNLPFDEVADDPAYVFLRTKSHWALSNRDPRREGL